MRLLCIRLVAFFTLKVLLWRRLKSAPPCPHCADSRPGAACVARNYGHAERCIRDGRRHRPLP